MRIAACLAIASAFVLAGCMQGPRDEPPDDAIAPETAPPGHGGGKVQNAAPAVDAFAADASAGEAGNYTVTFAAALSDANAEKDLVSLAIAASGPSLFAFSAQRDLGEEADSDDSAVDGRQATQRPAAFAADGWRVWSGPDRKDGLLMAEMQYDFGAESAPGAYNWTLTVTDKDGASASATVQVTVTAPPPPPSSAATTTSESSSTSASSSTSETSTTAPPGGGGGGSGGGGETSGSTSSTSSASIASQPQPLTTLIEVAQNPVLADGSPDASNAFGQWDALPGATDVVSSNYLKIVNAGSRPDTLVVVDFNEASFTGAEDAGYSVPIDGNLAFAWFEDTTPAETSPAEGIFVFAEVSPEGTIAIPFSGAGNILYVQYRIAQLPAVLPDQEYTASYTVTEL